MPLYLGKQKINKVLTEYSTTLVTLDTTDATATADKIFSGETAYANKQKLTGTFTIRGELNNQKSKIKDIKNAMKELGVSIPSGGGETLESVEWTQGGHSLGSIAYGNGVWVDGNFHYSTDGINWQASNLNFSSSDIKFGNGVFVATTPGEGIYYSIDGMTWTEAAGDAQSNGTYLGIGFNGSQWVICGSVDEETLIPDDYPILHSADGINWEEADWYEFNSITATYGDGKWMIAGWGYIIYSEDGHNWDYCDVDWDYFTDICYNNGTWIATAEEGIYRSTDGYEWTQVNNLDYFHHINYANDVWLATAYNGGVYYSIDDGITWIEGQLTGEYNCKPKFIDGLWVIAGENGIFYSADGINWTQTNVTSGTTYAYVTKENGILFAYCDNPYYSEGTYAAIEMTYNEELQQNNDDLALILNGMGNIDVNTTAIYVSENDAEPDASVGADGDLWLVVSAE